MYKRSMKIKQLGHAAIFLECIVTEYEFSIIREVHDRCVCNHDPYDNTITLDVAEYQELIFHFAKKYNVLTDIKMILEISLKEEL